MAEGKKSFIMYADYIHTVKHLTDEQAGLLFKHLLSYVNDEEPKTDNPFVNIAFEPIKQSLKRDLKKFKERKEERSKSGRLGNLKRYHKDLFDKVSNDLMELERAEEIAKTRKESLSEKNVAKLAVSDSDSDSDSVSDSDSDSDTSTNVDDVFKTIDVLKKEYLKDKKLCNAVMDNQNLESIEVLEYKLNEFNAHLTTVGNHSKEKADYNRHFLSWFKKRTKAKVNTNQRRFL